MKALLVVFGVALFLVPAAMACRSYEPPPWHPPYIPPPVTAPKAPQTDAESFCVQTVERGETFVQATPDAFMPGGDWYSLEQAGATVILDGHAVTLSWEDGKGVILAANVPGIGLTCAQPYVSTDGVYADPSYGLR